MRNNLSGSSGAQAYRNALRQQYQQQLSAAVQQIEAQRAAGQQAMSSTYKQVNPTVQDNLGGFTNAINTYNANLKEQMEAQQQAQQDMQKAWAAQAVKDIKAARKSAKSTKSAKAVENAVGEESSASENSDSLFGTPGKNSKGFSAGGNDAKKGESKNDEKSGIVQKLIAFGGAVDKWAKSESKAEQQLHETAKKDTAALNESVAQSVARYKADKSEEARQAAAQSNKFLIEKKKLSSADKNVIFNRYNNWIQQGENREIVDALNAIDEIKNEQQSEVQGAGANKAELEAALKQYSQKDIDQANEYRTMYNRIPGYRVTDRAVNTAAGLGKTTASIVPQTWDYAVQSVKNAGAELNDEEYKQATAKEQQALEQMQALEDAGKAYAYNEYGQVIGTTQRYRELQDQLDAARATIQERKAVLAAPVSQDTMGYQIYQSGQENLQRSDVGLSDTQKLIKGAATSAAENIAVAAVNPALVLPVLSAQGAADSMGQSTANQEAALTGLTKGVAKGIAGYAINSVGVEQMIDTMGLAGTRSTLAAKIVQSLKSKPVLSTIAQNSPTLYAALMGATDNGLQSFAESWADYAIDMATNTAEPMTAEQLLSQSLNEFASGALGGAFTGVAGSAVNAGRQALYNRAQNAQNTQNVTENARTAQIETAPVANNMKATDDNLSPVEQTETATERQRTADNATAVQETPISDNPAVQEVIANLTSGENGGNGNTNRTAKEFYMKVTPETARKNMVNRQELAQALGVEESVLPTENKEMRQFIQALTEADFAKVQSNASGKMRESRSAPIAHTNNATERAVQTMRESGMSAAAENLYRSSTQAGEAGYTRAFEQAYNAGADGAALNTKSAAYKMADEATQSILQQAYRQGRADYVQQNHESAKAFVPENVLNAQENRDLTFVKQPAQAETKGAARIVEKIAKAQGNRAVYWVEDAPFNGKKDGSGNIYLNADLSSGEAVRTYFGHEVTHIAEDGKTYAELSRYIQESDIGKEWVQKHGYDSFEEYAEAKFARYAQQADQTGDEAYRLAGREEAMQEVIADWCGENLLGDSAISERAIKELCGEHRSLAVRIKDFLADMAERFLGTSQEDELRHALNLFEKALDESNNNSNERYSINPDFVKDIDDWDKNGRQENKVFTLGTTGKALKSIGVQDKSIVMVSDKIIRILKDHRTMDMSMIKQIPEMLENPSLVLESSGKSIRTAGKKNSRVVVIGTIADKNNNPVICALDLMPKSAKDIKLGLQDFNKVSSTYAKEHGQKNFLQNSKVLYASGQKNKTEAALSSFGFQLATTELNRLGSIGRISYENGTVNIQGVPFSDVFSVKNTESETRFSLADPVEENKDLVAVHNSSVEGLTESLKLGGLPSPSIAIVKAQSGHTKYGDVSLVFDKSTIDPAASKANKVYGSDAWTPTKPRVDYEVNSKKAGEIDNEISRLAEKTAGGIFARSSVLASRGIDESTDMSIGEIADKLANDDSVLAAYLANQGKTLEPVRKAKEFSRKLENEMLSGIIDRVGIENIADAVAEMDASGSYKPVGKIYDSVKEVIQKDYERRMQKFIARKGEEAVKAKVRRYMDENWTQARVADEVRNAWEMYQDGGKTRGEIDRYATADKLRQAVDKAEVKAWVEEKLNGLLGEAGIYNGKDPYTAGGNRKSFKQLHNAYTLENLVAAMNKQQSARGEGLWGATASGLQAVTTPEYKNIGEIKADEGRLARVSKDEMAAALKAVDEKITDVIGLIREETETYSDNSYEENDIIGSLLIENAQKKTVSSIKTAFAKDGYAIGQETARQILLMYRKAAKLSTEYFEAKPQRAVGFGEVKAAIVPDDAPQKFVQELQQAGVQNVVRYEAGNETDRLAKLNDLQGIRFSLNEPDNISRENRKLARENQKLTEQNERLKTTISILKSEFKESAGHKVAEQSMNRLVTRLKAQNKSTIERSVLKNKLNRLFDYIATAETNELNFDDVMDVTADIAKDILNNSRETAESLRESEPKYNELYKKLGKVSVTPEEKARLTAAYGKAERGRINGIQIKVDEKARGLDDLLHNELTASYPEFFSDDILTSEDIFERMAQVRSALNDPIVDNESGMAYDEMAYSIAQQIWDEYMDMPDIGAKTYADKQADKFKAAKNEFSAQLKAQREQAKAAYEERLKAVQAENAQMQEQMRTEAAGLRRQLAKTRQELVQLNRQTAMQEQTIQKGQMSLEKLKTSKDRQIEKLETSKNQQIEKLKASKNRQIEKLTAELKDRTQKMRDLRSEKNQKIMEARARYNNKLVDWRMDRQATAMRDKIKRISSDLNQRLLNPTENKHIPQGLVKATAEVCDTVATMMGENEIAKGADLTEYREKLERFRTQYEKMQNDPDYAVSSEYSPEIKRSLNDLTELAQNATAVSDLKLDDLNRLYEILKTVQHSAITAKKLIGEEKESYVYDEAYGFVGEIRETKNKAPGGKISNELNRYHTDTTSAQWFFRRLGGYVENGYAERVGKMLDDGQLKKTRLIMEGSAVFKDVLSEKSRKVSGFMQANGDNAVKLQTSAGEINISHAMLCSLYMHAQNERNLRHIMRGGLKVPDMKLYGKKNTADAYANGQLVMVKYKDIQNAFEQMNDYDRAWCKDAKQFFEVWARKVINDTSMELVGFKKAGVENYYPIHTDRNFTNRSMDTVVQDGSIEGMGMLKKRVKGANTIYLENITDVVNRQLENTALYGGMAIPMRNFNKIYNQVVSTLNGADIGKDSVKNAITDKFGKNGISYIENLAADLQTGRGSTDSLLSSVLDSVRGNYAGSVLSFNPRVALGQTASLPTAAYTLGWTPILKATPEFFGNVGSAMVNGKKIQAYLDKSMEVYNNPLLQYRNLGNSTQEIGDLKNRKSLANIMPGSGWIQKMDTATVATLLRASEIWVNGNTNYTKGSAEYNKAVSDKFTETVEYTQPNYTAMQRTEVARTNNALQKVLTMFRTQRDQNANILIGSWENWRAQKARGDKAASKKAAQAFGRAVTSQLVQSAMYCLMQAGVDMFIYHDPDDYAAENGDITAESFGKGFGSNFVKTAAGSFLLGSTVTGVLSASYDIIKHGKSAYEVTKYLEPDVPGIGTIYDMIQNSETALEKTVKLQNSDLTDEEIAELQESRKKALWRLADTVGQASGIAIGPMKKTLGGLIKTMQGLERKARGERFFEDKIRESQKYTNLYNAIKDGNEDKQKEIVNALLATGNIHENDINSAMMSKLGEESDVKKAAQRYADNYLEFDDDIEDVIEKYANMGFSDWRVRNKITGMADSIVSKATEEARNEILDNAMDYLESNDIYDWLGEEDRAAVEQSVSSAAGKMAKQQAGYTQEYSKGETYLAKVSGGDSDAYMKLKAAYIAASRKATRYGKLKSDSKNFYYAVTQSGYSKSLQAAMLQAKNGNDKLADASADKIIAYYGTSAQADTDGNNSVSQDEFKAYVAKVGMSRSAAAYIWSLRWPKSKSNPYL